MKIRQYLNNIMAVIIGSLFVFLSISVNAEDKPWLGIAINDFSFQELEQRNLTYGIAIDELMVLLSMMFMMAVRLLNLV